MSIRSRRISDWKQLITNFSNCTGRVTKSDDEESEEGSNLDDEEDADEAEDDYTKVENEKIL